jgi:hypothetical protein
MSDYLDMNEVNNKLSLIVRKAQEGKTFICINSILSDYSNDIHIVLTMNTLSAGMQFFCRMEKEIGCKSIIVFNSDKKSAGDCLHASNVDEIFKLIRKHNNIKVIVCCAHTKRFAESIHNILETASDSASFIEAKRKFKLHIDEAHKYIVEYRNDVRKFNMDSMVVKITGYTATPDPIFSKDENDTLFYSILIRNIEEEFNIIRSGEYFGVKDCEKYIVENDDCNDEMQVYANEFEVTPIPINTVLLSLTESERRNGISAQKYWYGSRWLFNMGNEIELLSFYKYLLPRLNISNNDFSYHFTPAYTRKVTHYQVGDLILNTYPNANIIVINGNDNAALYRFIRISDRNIMRKIKSIKEVKPINEEHRKSLLEPSAQIQELIKEYPNCPTFVTGLMCVGMSITLVNPDIGNFDNIIMHHEHYKKEDVYQLNRYLFSYLKWSPESKAKIKRTKFYSYRQSVYDMCLKEEEHIEKFNEFGGKHVGLNEFYDPEIIPQTSGQIRREKLNSIKDCFDIVIKRFEIDDDDEEDKVAQFERAKNYYRRITGKNITERSMPKPDEKEDPRFLACSLTKTKYVHTLSEINKNFNGDKTWDSHLQLRCNVTRYATRIYVGYNSLEDHTKYTLFIKSVVLKNRIDEENVLNIINEYGKKIKQSNNLSSVANCGGYVEEEDEELSDSESLEEEEDL